MTETEVGHVNHDDVDVYAGRRNSPDGLRHMGNTDPGDPGWLGNPYRLKDGYTREEAIELYSEDLQDRIEEDPEFRKRVEGLAGKLLGCYCRTTDDEHPPCHADEIAKAADSLAEGK